MAELADHIVEQATLHRVVVYDEYVRDHWRGADPDCDCAVSSQCARLALSWGKQVT
jgi:hypothetical protein